jgi:OmpA-OmpF porin, OOP family
MPLYVDLKTLLFFPKEPLAMKTLSIATLIAAAVAFSSSVNAQENKFNLHLDGGGIFFDDPLKDDFVYGAGFGYNFNEHWGLDLVGSKYKTETEAGGIDVDGTQYRLDGLYHFDTTSAWRPYAAFGIGEHKREAASVTADDTLLNVGGGIKRALGEHFEFRTDIRAFRSLDEDYTDLVLGLGIAFVFGKTEAPAPKPMTKVAPPAPVMEKDTDGDGVLDSKDKCPDTPKAHKVDAMGCSIQLTETVAIELKITFDSSKAIIKPEFESEVANLANFMNQYAGTVVTVEGHTDSQGADAFNKQLSQSRADAVKTSLISNYGIDASRVTAIGYGEAQPIADNETAEGRKQNRRVVGKVSTDVTKTEMKK